MGRGDPTNDEWARLQPHLPESGQRGGRWASHRRVTNGILFRQRTGVPWRDLPARFGKGKTVYERHRSWSADGMWDKVYAAVLADADTEGRIDRSMVSMDSTSCRAHQHAAGARERPPRCREETHAPGAPPRRGTRTLPGRPHLQEPSRRRRRAPRLGPADHPRPVGRRPATHPRHGTYPRRPPRWREPPHPTGPSRR